MVGGLILAFLRQSVRTGARDGHLARVSRHGVPAPDPPADCSPCFSPARPQDGADGRGTAAGHPRRAGRLSLSRRTSSSAGSDSRLLGSASEPDVFDDGPVCTRGFWGLYTVHPLPGLTLSRRARSASTASRGRCHSPQRRSRLGHWPSASCSEGASRASMLSRTTGTVENGGQKAGVAEFGQRVVEASGYRIGVADAAIESPAVNRYKALQNRYRADRLMGAEYR